MKLEEKSKQRIYNDILELDSERMQNEQRIEAAKDTIRYLEARNEKLQNKAHTYQHALDMRNEADKVNIAA